jgi:hypothetical protein
VNLDVSEANVSPLPVIRIPFTFLSDRTHMREIRISYRILDVKPDVKIRSSANLGADGRTILKLN